MAPQRHLDPRAWAAIEQLRSDPGAWTGPILIRNLPAALPARGSRRSWKDAVTILLLAELIGVHRVKQGRDPYWRGALYQLNRNHLAKEFACDPDEISAASRWLHRLGLVVVIRRTRIDGDGKPCGTEVFAVPLMDRIRAMLDVFVERGYAMTASELTESNPRQGGLNSPSAEDQLVHSGASTGPEEGSYPNCDPEQKSKSAESDDATSEPHDREVHEVRSHVVAGGGGAADTESTQVPPAPSPAAATQSPGTAPSPAPPPSKGNGPASPAPPALWTPPAPPKGVVLDDYASRNAWLRAARFIEMWSQGLTRNAYATVCEPTPGDLKAAFKFFHEHPQITSFWAMAVAWNAWRAADQDQTSNRWDPLYHCRRSREIRAFLRDYASSKLESEIGRHGWTINPWVDLRQSFTPSELVYYGWPKVPIVAIEPDELWENDSTAPLFYSVHKLPLPPELVAIQKLRSTFAH